MGCDDSRRVGTAVVRGSEVVTVVVAIVGVFVGGRLDGYKVGLRVGTTDEEIVEE